MNSGRRGVAPLPYGEDNGDDGATGQLSMAASALSLLAQIACLFCAALSSFISAPSSQEPDAVCCIWTDNSLIRCDNADDHNKTSLSNHSQKKNTYKNSSFILMSRLIAN